MKRILSLGIKNWKHQIPFSSFKAIRNENSFENFTSNQTVLFFSSLLAISQYYATSYLSLINEGSKQISNG